MTTNQEASAIVLVPGNWLGAWAWNDVQEQLTALGRKAVSLTLPGLDEADPNRNSKTIADQAEAIERTASDADRPVTIVAHSGANVPVTKVMDQHPELFDRVIWVDSGPATSGAGFGPDLPPDVVEVELPPFEVLSNQASLEGLSPEDLARLRARAVAQPATLLGDTLQLTNDARFDVPSTFICCSMPSVQIIELVEAGHPMFTEVSNYKNVEYIDLPTGHWPMWSRPRDLAQLIAEI